MAKGKRKKRAKAAKAKAEAVPPSILLPSDHAQKLKYLKCLWSSISNAKSPFLKLPAEIRVMIYEYALEGIKSGPMSTDRFWASDCTHPRSNSSFMDEAHAYWACECKRLASRSHLALWDLCRQTRADLAALSSTKHNYPIHLHTCLIKMSAKEKATIRGLRIRLIADPFRCLTCEREYPWQALHIAKYLPYLSEVVRDEREQKISWYCEYSFQNMYDEGPGQLAIRVRRALGLDERSGVTVRLEVKLSTDNYKARICTWKRNPT